MDTKSNYMTIEECKKRLWQDMGRTDFHVVLRLAPESEERYLEILNFMKRQLNIYDLDQIEKH